jgi:hypothetical protein
MKIPYVKTNSVEEYFNLPKKEREHFGFYRLPFSLPCDIFDEDVEGWKIFYSKLKKEYPIQWFFRSWMFSFQNPIYSFIYSYFIWPVRDFKWAVDNFISPCFPIWRNTIPRHKYADGVHLIIESNFNIILDFYNEASESYIDWESSEEHSNFYKKLEEYKNWIKTERKKINQIMDIELSIATNNKHIKDYKEKYKTYDLLEQDLKNKETEILNWMVENRSYFWT